MASVRMLAWNMEELSRVQMTADDTKKSMQDDRYTMESANNTTVRSSDMAEI